MVGEIPRLIGVDRVGLWLYDPENKRLRGTFGTDEAGRLRDERSLSLNLDPESEDFDSHLVRDNLFDLIEESNQGRTSSYRVFEGDLTNAVGEIFGKGAKMVVAVWGAKRVRAFLFADNLLRGGPIDENQVEKILLFAAVIGQNLEHFDTLNSLREQTEHLENERRLAESITNAIDEVVFARDLEGRYLFANEGWRKVNPDVKVWPIVGKTLEEVFPPDLANERRQRDREVIKAGTSLRRVATQRFGDFQDQCLECNSYPVRDAEGVSHAVAHVIRNITDQEEHREQLTRQMQIAKDALRAKSDFVAVMNHELRTPLNAIIGPSDFLLEMDLPAEQRELVGMIGESARRMLNLVNGILDIARLDAGHTRINLKRIELRVFLAECLSSLRALANNKGLHFTLNIDPSVPDFVQSDEDLLSTILTNLVSNAIKFTDHGEVAVEIARSGDHIRLAIRDTGDGIDSSDLKHLFKAFKQVGKNRMKRAKGTGLGLSICQRLASLLQTEILVKSEPGNGSTFWLEIPCQLDPESESP